MPQQQHAIAADPDVVARLQLAPQRRRAAAPDYDYFDKSVSPKTTSTILID
jgi:hypothetical protein